MPSLYFSIIFSVWGVNHTRLPVSICTVLYSALSPFIAGLAQLWINKNQLQHVWSGEVSGDSLPAFHPFRGHRSRCHSQLCPGGFFSSSPSFHRSVWSPGQGTNASLITFKQKSGAGGRNRGKGGNLVAFPRSPSGQQCWRGAELGDYKGKGKTFCRLRHLKCWASFWRWCQKIWPCAGYREPSGMLSRRNPVGSEESMCKHHLWAAWGWVGRHREVF